MTIQAIETRYAGCRFRSRLEARWAVFFDHLGIKWEYEPQGYIVGGDRRYLPDFHLDIEHGVWVEVKGDPAALDVGLVVAAVESLHRPFLILGPIERPRDGYPPCHVMFNRLDDVRAPLGLYGIDEEQRILARLLCCDDSGAAALGILRREDFYRPAHGILYEAICLLVNKRECRDLHGLEDELAARGELLHVGGPSYLEVLRKIDFGAVSAEADVQTVADRAKERDLWKPIILAEAFAFSPVSDGGLNLSGTGITFQAHQREEILSPDLFAPAWELGCEAYEAARSARFEHGESGAPRTAQTKDPKRITDRDVLMAVSSVIDDAGELANHYKAIDMDGARVPIIKCDSAESATQFTLRAASILREVNDILGGGFVPRLKVRRVRS